jgi:hypothetical protein
VSKPPNRHDTRRGPVSADDLHDDEARRCRLAFSLGFLADLWAWLLPSSWQRKRWTDWPTCRIEGLSESKMEDLALLLAVLNDMHRLEAIGGMDADAEPVDHGYS